MPPILKSEIFADAKKACTIKEGFNAEKRAVQHASVSGLFRERREKLEFNPQAAAG